MAQVSAEHTSARARILPFASLLVTAMLGTLLSIILLPILGALGSWLLAIVSHAPADLYMALIVRRLL